MGYLSGPTIGGQGYQQMEGDWVDSECLGSYGSQKRQFLRICNHLWGVYFRGMGSHSACLKGLATIVEEQRGEQRAGGRDRSGKGWAEPPPASCLPLQASHQLSVWEKLRASSNKGLTGKEEGRPAPSSLPHRESQAGNVV